MSDVLACRSNMNDEWFIHQLINHYVVGNQVYKFMCL